jgi:hypothetical protein
LLPAQLSLFGRHIFYATLLQALQDVGVAELQRRLRALMQLIDLKSDARESQSVVCADLRIEFAMLSVASRTSIFIRQIG